VRSFLPLVVEIGGRQLSERELVEVLRRVLPRAAGAELPSSAIR
jgi:hypothetical protein